MFANKLNSNSSGAKSPLAPQPVSPFPAFPSVDFTIEEFRKKSLSNSISLFDWNTYLKRKVWSYFPSSAKSFRLSSASSKPEKKNKNAVMASSSSPSSLNGMPSYPNAKIPNSDTLRTPASSSNVPLLEKKKATNACNRSLSDIHAPTWLGLLVCNTFIRVSLFHPLQLSLARKRVVQEKSPPSVFRWIAAAHRGGVKVLPGMKTPIDFGPGGIRGVYRGYGAAFLSGMTSSIVYLFTMETLKEKLIKATAPQNGSTSDDLADVRKEDGNQFSGHRWATAAGATAADALTLFVVTPIAVVVGRQMTSGVGLAADNPYRSIPGTFRHLWQLHQPRAEERLRRRPMSAAGGRLGNTVWMWLYKGCGEKRFDHVLEYGREESTAAPHLCKNSKNTSIRSVTLPTHGSGIAVEKGAEATVLASSVSTGSSNMQSKSRVTSSSSSRAAQPRSLRMPISTGVASATTRVSAFSSVSALPSVTPGSNATMKAVIQKKRVGSSLLSFLFPRSFLTPSSSSSASSRLSLVSSLGRKHLYPIRRQFWYTVYGFRGLYQGLSAALLRIPFSGVWWASYTTAKEAFYNTCSPTLRHLQATHSHIPGASWIFSPCDNLLLNAFASASASVMTTLMVSPLSVLQVRLQALSTSTTTEATATTGTATRSAGTSRQGKKGTSSGSPSGSVVRGPKKGGDIVTMRRHHLPRSGLLQMASDILRKEGIRGFYKGASTNVSIAILDGMVFSVLFEVTRMLSDVNYGASKKLDAPIPAENS